ncbi:AI-2E family transporter [Heliobacterium gestii]|uniref:AI-2E family transporter n=1 Tax=Heliomicrobium gestii TaxID=2699 RepID=A0A845LDV6_HELGE|nr:AI-2E family transporter [Heliomicrobium gestii]MBM7868103.1 putative PurR-regulated permease PerM [Heliomicrobium gestii]MZP44368.1 AI-2E family transporter [Heliomicrobium gestii]
MEVEAALSNGRWRILLVAGFWVILLLLAYLVRQTLLPFAIAFVLAYLLYPGVIWLEKRGLGRIVSILAVFAVVLGGFGSLVAFGLPRIFGELNRFSVQLPQYSQELQAWLTRIQQDMIQAGFPPGIQQVWSETLSRGEGTLLAAVRWVLQSAVSLAENALDIVLIPVMSFYFLRDWEAIGKGSLHLAPQRLRAHVQIVGGEVNRVLRAVVRCNFLMAFVVGVLTTVGLTLIGLEYSLLIGIIAGIADLIPYFGPLIGMAPAVVVGLLESPRLALYAVLVMIIVQQIESNLLQPKLLGDSVGLHPLAVIFALLAGGHLFGIVGLLLAVPVAAVGKVVGRYVLLKVLV